MKLNDEKKTLCIKINVLKRIDNRNNHVSWWPYWDFQIIVVYDSKSREIKRKIKKQIFFMILGGDSLIGFKKAR